MLTPAQARLIYRLALEKPRSSSTRLADEFIGWGLFLMLAVYVWLMALSIGFVIGVVDGWLIRVIGA